MTKEDRKNAFLYCKFRDEQFALYDEYAKNNGICLLYTSLKLQAPQYQSIGFPKDLPAPLMQGLFLYQ